MDALFTMHAVHPATTFAAIADALDADFRHDKFLADTLVRGAITQVLINATALLNDENEPTLYSSAPDALYTTGLTVGNLIHFNTALSVLASYNNDMQQIGTAYMAQSNHAAYLRKIGQYGTPPYLETTALIRDLRITMDVADKYFTYLIRHVNAGHGVD